MTRKAGWWFVIILMALAALGFTRLRLDVDILDLLPTQVPVVQGLKLYQRHFTDASELILTVQGPDADQTESASRALANSLQRQTNLVASVLWQPAWLEHPAQAAELIAYLWLNQPPEVFGELTNRLSGAGIDTSLAQAKDQLATSFSPLDVARRAYDPYDLLNLPASVTAGAGSFGNGQELFGSPDGTFRILFVKASEDLANYRQCIQWLGEIKQAVAQARRGKEFAQDVKIGFTGGPAFTAEISAGMEHDMTSSVGITSLIIAVLFWIFHRRLTPMLWLLVLLAVILICTLALGGLLFGAINVVSLGFAGILLGLAVDYGVVHYQEALASPEATIPEIRRAIGPSIFWAAVTTISAFLVLNFGGLPGLAQLGSLVALGVTLSALVMLFAFLPPLFRDRARKRLSAASGLPEHTTQEAPSVPSSALRTAVLGLTALIVLLTLAVLVSGLPRMDHTADALRPRHSPAYAALDEIKAHLAQNRDPLWLITQGRDSDEIAQRLAAVEPVLTNAVNDHLLASYNLPTPLWPRSANQMANHAAAKVLIDEREPLRAAALAQGFSTNSLVMMDAILNTWNSARQQPGVFWPTNPMSRWVFDKIAARTTNGLLAVGFLFRAPDAVDGRQRLKALAEQLSARGFILSGWELLGSSILGRVQQRLWFVLAPMASLVLLSLWLAFRRWREIALSLGVLALSGLCLLTVMRLAGWSWNLLNLMALPLMLGAGVDYSIFMQLALRRHQGDRTAAHRSVGRALLLCGGTAVAGFGSLSWSTNAGMASLGQVCATGIAANMLISVFLLPIWWSVVAGANATPPTSGPSGLYRAEFWRVGQFCARRLPPGLVKMLTRVIGGLYWRLAAHRRRTVIENLLPVVDGDRARAEAFTRKLFQNFALKLAHLWRYESGCPVDDLFGKFTGWEHFEAAQQAKRGILVLTPHLGNWEFGGPLLTKRGVRLQVITLAEPGRGFTELRQASRARWNIETLVIGDDPFAVVEVIRRLEAGATVALLVDRPPPRAGAMVELFGRPFAASLAAAELARASGCVLLPVFLPHTESGYAAHILPPINYDRPSLRQAEARQQLTQKIMQAFEPAIRQHPDQWYHFVPIWPGETGCVKKGNEGKTK